MKVGDTVRVDARYWIRANAVGTIAEFDGSRGDNHWRVEFAPEVGRGFDGGRFLWLSDWSLNVEDAGKQKGKH